MDADFQIQEAHRDDVLRAMHYDWEQEQDFLRDEEETREEDE